MKRMILYLSIAVVAAGAIFSACESKEKQVDNAQQKVADDKANMQASKDTMNAEYAGFKDDAEKKILANDQKIAHLKEQLNHDGNHPLDNKRRSKIDDLQRMNAELSTRLAKYQSAQTDWATFKTQFNADMDTLNAAYVELDKKNDK